MCRKTLVAATSFVMLSAMLSYTTLTSTEIVSVL